MRFLITCLSLILSASPLFAGARLAAPNATTPAEAVNWTAGVNYSYDRSGNVTQIGDDRFKYDHAGRLVQADVNGAARTYQYDAFGNRTRCTHAPGTATQGDCQAGMTIDSASNRVNGVRYDAAGNITTYYGHTYTYDGVNMPVRDDRGNGLAKEFIYTADDERLATSTVGSTWNWTLRDTNGKVLREFTSDGTSAFTWARDYVYRADLLVASVQRPKDTVVTYHYHLDHLGTARRVTDHNNRTVGFHDYYAFGPEISGALTEPLPSSLQYTGHERDKWGVEGPDTLDYMHARYYSPTLGRFLSVDMQPGKPFAPQTWNRYAYARNSPFLRIDPNGLEDVIIFKTERNPKRDPADPWGKAVGYLERKYTREFEGRYKDLTIKVVPVTAVWQVNAVLASSKDVVKVAFVGHSDSSKIAVGNADAPGTNISISGGKNDVSPFKLDWSKLKAEATIDIWGCNAGSGDDPVAQSVANAAQVPVTAPDAYLNFNEETGQPFLRTLRFADFLIFRPQGTRKPKPKPAGACIEGQPACR